MNARRFSSGSTTAVLFLCAAALAASLPVGCSSKNPPADAGGVGGQPAPSDAGGGTGGRAGTGGSNGSGGRAGGTDAGTDARGSGGAGGTITIVDAAGNTFTCADLLTCCNRVTNTQLMAACLLQYNTLSTQGDQACGNFLVQVRANGGCP